MASGFNVVDFMDLPPAERCLIRLVLRQMTMTYPELHDEVAAMPVAQRLDETQFDAALEHLIRTEWLITQVADGEPVYNVNAIQRNSTGNARFWDDLDLAGIGAEDSYRLDLHTLQGDHPMMRGKRKLPNHIWDCLTAPQEEGPSEAPTRKPARRGGLLDAFVEQDTESKNK